MPLDDTGLVARYYIDEAASGTGPTELVDSSGVGTAMNVPITYGSGLSFAEVSGNRCLEASSTASSGIATTAALTAGNKIYDNLHGSQVATLEYVMDVDAGNTNGARVFGLMNGDTGNGTLIFTVGVLTGSSTKRFNGVGTPGYNWNPPTGRIVVHLVIDTTQATAADRMKSYVDGSLVNVVDPGITQNATIAFSDTRLVFMNRGSVDRSIDGRLFYGAVYSVAFSSTRVTDHFDVLTLDDDAPAGGGGNRRRRLLVT